MPPADREDEDADVSLITGAMRSRNLLTAAPACGSSVVLRNQSTAVVAADSAGTLAYAPEFPEFPELCAQRRFSPFSVVPGGAQLEGLGAEDRTNARRESGEGPEGHRHRVRGGGSEVVTRNQSTRGADQRTFDVLLFVRLKHRSAGRWLMVRPHEPAPRRLLGISRYSRSALPPASPGSLGGGSEGAGLVPWGGRRPCAWRGASPLESSVMVSPRWNLRSSGLDES